MQKSNSVARRIAIVWLIALGAFAATMLLSIGLARCLARLSGSADPAAWVQAVGRYLCDRCRFRHDYISACP